METQGVRNQNDAEAGRDRPAEIIILSTQLSSGLPYRFHEVTEFEGLI